MLERVLIADDSGPVKKAIKIALRAKNIEILEADSYVSALRLCKSFKPQLIISDIGLTGTSSPKEFLNLQSNSEGARILMLQGSFEQIDTNEYINAGFKSFMRKPFTANQIRDIIEKEFDQKQEDVQESSLESSAELSLAPESMIDKSSIDDDKSDSFFSVESKIEQSRISDIEEKAEAQETDYDYIDEERESEFSPLTVSPEESSFIDDKNQSQPISEDYPFSQIQNNENQEDFLSRPPEELSDMFANNENDLSDGSQNIMQDNEEDFISGMSEDHSDIVPVSGQESLFERAVKEKYGVPKNDEYPLSQGPGMSDDFPPMTKPEQEEKIQQVEKSLKDGSKQHVVRNNYDRRRDDQSKEPPVEMHVETTKEKIQHQIEDSTPSNISTFSGSSNKFRHWFLPLYEREILPFIKKEIQKEVKLEVQKQLQSSVKQYCEDHFAKIAKEVIKEELRKLVSRL